MWVSFRTFQGGKKPHCIFRLRKIDVKLFGKWHLFFFFPVSMYNCKHSCALGHFLWLVSFWNKYLELRISVKQETKSYVHSPLPWRHQSALLNVLGAWQNLREVQCLYLDFIRCMQKYACSHCHFIQSLWWIPAGFWESSLQLGIHNTKSHTSYLLDLNHFIWCRVLGLCVLSAQPHYIDVRPNQSRLWSEKCWSNKVWCVIKTF